MSLRNEKSKPVLLNLDVSLDPNRNMCRLAFKLNVAVLTLEFFQLSISSPQPPQTVTFAILVKFDEFRIVKRQTRKPCFFVRNPEMFVPLVRHAVILTQGSQFSRKKYKAFDNESSTVGPKLILFFYDYHCLNDPKLQILHIKIWKKLNSKVWFCSWKKRTCQKF